MGKQIGPRVLFSKVNLTIGISDRIGLVGPNGSGKTTLLEILAGRIEPDEGSVSRNRRATVGYLPQEVPRFSDRALLDELLAGHETIDHLRAQLTLVEEEMRRASGEEELRSLAEKQGELERRFDSEGGYDLPSAGKKILGGLGFRESDFTRPAGEFSGGWLMRLALARLLLIEPSLLLLDEPTNYLDLESVVWLEAYLRSYEGALVAVSHDRTLLNAVANRIWEIDGEQIVSYTGNYDASIRARRLREEQLAAAKKAQERFLAKERRFIERFRYKNTKAKAVQSRIKRLEKMETITGRAAQKSVRIRMPEPPPSARIQLELKGLSKSYGDHAVYTGIDFAVERGERIALVGRNGAGKSTLMKILAGVLPFEAGERRLGKGVEVGYFAQHQMESLRYDATVLDEVASAAPGMTTEQVRSLLGRFLFTKDDVFKKIGVLSGGEKVRVALAKLLASPPNVILLDEPTSHLDIRSREVLEEALGEYGGSLVIISHDRSFLDALVTRVVEAGGGTIASRLGTYADYLRRREEELAASGETAEKRDAPRRTGRKIKSKEERRAEALRRNELYRVARPLREKIASLEEEIGALEKKAARFEEEMADPSFYEKGERFGDVFREYNDTRAVIASKTERWEELAEELERLTGDGRDGADEPDAPEEGRAGKRRR